MRTSINSLSLILLLLSTACLVSQEDRDKALADQQVDADGDGHYASPWGDDCDDTNPNIYAGATEICDGFDNDCDGQNANVFDIDWDGDGWLLCEIQPGLTPFNADGGGDCDDENPDINPGAVELCNGINDDCDEDTDEPDAINAPLWYSDVDGDEFGDAATGTPACMQPGDMIADNTDCNDTDTTISPNQSEICDGQDNDCDSTTPSDELDDDQDGYVECTLDSGGWDGAITPDFSEMLGNDCDDTNSAIYPTADEICDGGIDNNCNGLADNDDSSVTDKTSWYIDSDSDGFGNNGSLSELSCEQPTGKIDNDADCNDQDAAVHPNATEECYDGIDNDCEGSIDGSDSVDARDWFIDADADGFGDSSISSGTYCEAPNANTVADNTDCDDTEATIYPTASEICDGQDNDCSRTGTDDGIPLDELDDDQDGYVECDIDDAGWDGPLTPTFSTMQGNDCDDTDSVVLDGQDYYTDSDGDGYGLTSGIERLCSLQSGYAVQGGDCLDIDNTVYPTAAEICDGQDNDCDSAIPTDETDVDDDGYVACTVDSGGWDDQAIQGGDDCDNTQATIYPTATELCDGADNNCDTVVPDDELDLDSDNWVECAWSQMGTTAWLGATEPDGGEDCADTDASINPGADELCSTQAAAAIDYNCDGDTESGAIDGTTHFQDSDGDHFGNPQVSNSFCSSPTGWNLDNTDCDDTNVLVNPNAIEICGDQLDNDCQNGADGPDAVNATLWYEDSDSDGYGDSSGTNIQNACTQPSGFVANADDCVDADTVFDTSTIYVGAAPLDDPSACMWDADGDGYGDASALATLTAAGLEDGTDCDDRNANTYVGAAEFESPTFCLEDADNDGWGAMYPTSVAKPGTDCDDSQAQTFPGAAEYESAECMQDVDEDGWGSEIPSNAYISPGQDCSDTDATIHPTAAEIANDEIDQDCDGQDLETYIALEAGMVVTCGLNYAGEPRCWGRSDSNNPVDLVRTTPPAGNFSEVSTSWTDDIACVVDSFNQQVECWGSSVNPVATSPTTAVFGLDLGLDTACAIQALSPDVLECWGGCLGGPLCNNTPTANFSDSTSSSSLQDEWSKVVIGPQNVACAISSTYGQVVCWGETGSLLYINAPTLPTAADIYASNVNEHTDIAMSQAVACTIYSSFSGSNPVTGAIHCWGDNNHPVYSQAPTGTYWTDISCGPTYCCVEDGGLNVECWGDVPSATPTSAYTNLSVGLDFSCGIDSLGFVECWGDNSEGQCDHP